MSREPNDTPASVPVGETPPRPAAPGPLRSVLRYTRGLIFNQHLRRLTMFYTVLAAMLMVFAGDSLLAGWLAPREHFLRFALYWLACGWLTIVSALLAIYDMLLIRVQHRLARRALRTKMLGQEGEIANDK